MRMADFTGKAHAAESLGPYWVLSVNMLLENEGVRCQVSAIKNYKSQNTNIKQITMTEIQNSKHKRNPGGMSRDII